MTAKPASKPFVPKQIFLAYQFFLKGVYFDHCHQFDKAEDIYLRSSKIFTYLTKNHSDMTLFELWVEQAQLAIDRVKQLNSPQFNLISQSTVNLPEMNKSNPGSLPTKDDKEEQELRQRCYFIKEYFHIHHFQLFSWANFLF